LSGDVERNLRVANVFLVRSILVRASPKLMTTLRAILFSGPDSRSLLSVKSLFETSDKFRIYRTMLSFKGLDMRRTIAIDYLCS
jgi:hypothetical protein